MATLADAIALAAEAHDGQTDRSGQPYILHPLRVLLRLRSDEERQVAALHDVVERTEVKLEQLRERGFDEGVVEAVAALSRGEGEDYFDFVRRAMTNPLARPVKRADLLDNIQATRREARGAKRDQRLKRYLRALRMVDAEDAPAAGQEPSPGASDEAFPAEAAHAGDLPAELGGRLLLLEHLASARAALDRLLGGDDAEALHDFRVALRRLRTIERAMREVRPRLVGRGSRRRLQAMARATSELRDAEVRLVLLDGLTAVAGEAAVAWVRARLEEQLQPARDAVLEQVPAEFQAVRKRLRRRLSRYRVRPARMLAGPTFEKALAPAAEELRERLVTILAAGPHLPDDRLHAARITCKRLRYTIESLQQPTAGAALGSLRRLQDQLGSARDLAAFDAALAALSPPDDVAGGVARLRQQAQQERTTIVQEMEAHWTGDSAASAAIRSVDVLLARLATRPAPTSPRASAGRPAPGASAGPGPARRQPLR